MNGEVRVTVGVNCCCTCRMNTDSNTTLDSGKILKPDLFSNQLCPKEPARAGKIQGAPEQATLHVLVAFGLQVSKCAAFSVCCLAISVQSSCWCRELRNRLLIHLVQNSYNF